MKNRGRLMELRAEVLGEGGQLLAEGDGVFMKLDAPLSQRDVRPGAAERPRRCAGGGDVSAFVSTAWLEEHLRRPEPADHRSEHREGVVRRGAHPGRGLGRPLRRPAAQRRRLVGRRADAGAVCRADEPPRHRAGDDGRLVRRPPQLVRHPRLLDERLLPASPAASYVLEGGRERWIAEGRPMTSDVDGRRRRRRTRCRRRTDESNRATWQQVRDAIGAPDQRRAGRAIAGRVRRDERPGEARRPHPRRGAHRMDGRDGRRQRAAQPPTSCARCTSAARRDARQGDHRPLPARHPRRAHVVRAEARARLPEREELRRLVAGVGQPRRPAGGHRGSAHPERLVRCSMRASTRRSRAGDRR